MTFMELVNEVYEHAQRRLPITKQEAKVKAVEMILEGFRNLEDAVDYYEAFKDQPDSVFYTAAGWEVSRPALRHAIKLADEWGYKR